jgi:hypothetical protein
MVDKTLAQLITQTQRTLYQQAGIGVQVYSQDNIAQKIQDSFDFIFDNKKWKRFGTSENLTLNGTTGRFTVNPTLIRQYDHIDKVFRADSDVPLTAFSNERNPNYFTGDQALQYMPDTTSLIRIVPYTSTGVITITGRAYPLARDFILTDVIPFDGLALSLFAAYQYCADDQAYAAQADKLQGLFDQRIKDLWNNQNSEPISLNPNRVDIPSRWYND